MHERLRREIRDVLRLTTAPSEKRGHAGHVRAVHGLKLSDGPLRGTLTRPQKRTRRARNTHMQYLVKPLAHVTSPRPRSGVIPGTLAQASAITPDVRTAAAEAWVLARILLRLVAAGIVAWQGVAAASRGGAWYLLAIPLFLLAAFFVVTTAAILWVWGRELRSVGGHS